MISQSVLIKIFQWEYCLFHFVKNRDRESNRKPGKEKGTTTVLKGRYNIGYDWI